MHTDASRDEIASLKHSLIYRLSLLGSICGSERDHTHDWRFQKMSPKHVLATMNCQKLESLVTKSRAEGPTLFRARRRPRGQGFVQPTLIRQAVLPIFMEINGEHRVFLNIL